MTYEDIIKKVAEENNMPTLLVDRVYKAYWKAIRNHVSSLPLKEDLTDEEFNKLRPNVNIPYIGKLYVTLDDYRRKKARFNKITENLDKHVTHNKD